MDLVDPQHAGSVDSRAIKSDVITASAAISAAAWESGVHLLEGLRPGPWVKDPRKMGSVFYQPLLVDDGDDI